MTSKKVYFVFFILFFFSVGVFSQNLDIVWQNTIGGADNDLLYSIFETSDNGFIIGGKSTSNISGDKNENSIGFSDYWILKLNSSGEIEWQNTIGGSGVDNLKVVFQSVDGGYIIGGYSFSDISGDKTEDSNGFSDYWVLKLDVSGAIVWQNTIGGNFSDELNTMIPTLDGGILIGGNSISGISGDKTEPSQGGADFWILKLDANGLIVWQNTIGGDRGDHLESMVQTTDGGYVLAGKSESDISGDKTENSNGDWDYWVVKVSDVGLIEWQNTIGGSLFDDLHDIKQTDDGGYILGGHSRSDSSGDKSEDSLGSSDYWIIRLNASGDIVWENTIGGSGQEEMSKVIVTNDGGFLIAGWSSSNSSIDKLENSLGGFDFWLLKLNAFGLIQDQNTIGGNGPDLIRDVVQLSTGGIVVAGHSFSNISGDKTENSNGLDDYWVLGLSGSLGLEMNVFIGRYKIYPNPTQNILNIESFEDYINNVRIFNANGLLVLSLVDLGASPVISMATLSSGIYFLQITSKRNTSFMKFIKQ